MRREWPPHRLPQLLHCALTFDIARACICTFLTCSAPLFTGVCPSLPTPVESQRCNPRPFIHAFTIKGGCTFSKLGAARPSVCTVQHVNIAGQKAQQKRELVTREAWAKVCTKCRVQHHQTFAACSARHNHNSHLPPQRCRSRRLVCWKGGLLPQGCLLGCKVGKRSH